MLTVDRSTSFHKEQMDRNNVKWGGGVGPTDKNPPSTKDFQAALGNRYFLILVKPKSRNSFSLHALKH